MLLGNKTCLLQADRLVLGLDITVSGIIVSNETESSAVVSSVTAPSAAVSRLHTHAMTLKQTAVCRVKSVASCLDQQA